MNTIEVIYEDESGELWLLHDVDSQGKVKIRGVDSEGYYNGEWKTITKDNFKEMTIFRIF